MADPADAYVKGVAHYFTGGINYTSDTIRVILLGASYTPSQAHEFKSSLTNEISGTGYTAGGKALSSKTISVDQSAGTITLTAANPVWSTATLTGIRYAVFYKDTGTASTSPLLSYMDFGTPFNVSGENYTIKLPTTGIWVFKK